MKKDHLSHTLVSLGLTKIQLAKMLGVSFPTILRWFRYPEKVPKHVELCMDLFLYLIENCDQYESDHDISQVEILTCRDFGLKVNHKGKTIYKVDRK